MPISNRIWWQPRAWALALLLLSAGAVQAQNAGARAACEKSFKPSTGQPGKDVVWVPTNDPLVIRMLEMAKVGKTDLVYDLGAGDGKIAIAAAKQFGARAIGVEYNPDMAQLAQCLVRADGVADKVKIVQGDIFETDFSSASVVTLYLLPELNLKLRPTILKMKPGTRVVSHSFLMEEWRPDESSVSTDGAAYLWIVPADAAGKWSFKQQRGDDSFDVDLQQTFQKLTGTVGQEEITNAELKGTHIELMFSEGDVHTRLKGEIKGKQIEAEVFRNDKTSTYIGTRQ
ncbi:class I SAM-dependent methyltransferase [Steroidobacter sp.]|uniref:class I SAM-dependent methyltransferase n=1 Tax=Steroidobacter sp. TaxID=1978227 RepID=UPI001A3CDE92|nr:class I SAM-dependent methyltransferase [Steroidobacter sp.]MBL8272060.1 class I SAM-dependent methyltransferase [Steroidobacter sp.]